jgi:hypothetical protein
MKDRWKISSRIIITSEADPCRSVANICYNCPKIIPATIHPAHDTQLHFHNFNDVSVTTLCFGQSSAQGVMGTKEHQQDSHESDEKTLILERNVSILRGLLVLSILFAGGLIGGLSYSFIRNYETKYMESTFLHGSKEHFDSLANLIFLQANLNLQFATSLGLSCPFERDWPNCELSTDDINFLTHSLHEISEIDQFIVAPIVRPEDRHSFESFAKELYNRDRGYQNGTGISNFGFGIFDLTMSGEHIRSPNHTETRYDLLTPILLSSKTEMSNMYMKNIHSAPIMEDVIDGILNCVNYTTHNESFHHRHSSEGNPTLVHNELFSRQHHCTFLTDTCSNVSTEYSAILTAPIFPHKNPEQIVGFVAAKFSWVSALSSSISHKFKFQCTIESSTDLTPHHYLINHGAAHEIQTLQSPTCSDNLCATHLKKSYLLEVRDVNGGISSYTITYRPGDQSSDLPAIIACVCCLGVTLVISAIFLCFNFLINKQVVAATLLLDSKRTYVRFISHEIRSHLLS